MKMRKCGLASLGLLAFVVALVVMTGCPQDATIDPGSPGSPATPGGGVMDFNVVSPDSVEFGAAFGPKNYRFYHLRYDQMSSTSQTEDNKHERALKTPAQRTLTLKGAWQNDVVNAQLVTWTAPGSGAKISVHKTDLTNGSGHTIPASDVVISRLKYIFTNNGVSYYSNGAIGDYTESAVQDNVDSNALNYYADALYATTDKERSVAVAAKNFQPYWINVHTRNAQPGNYTGKIYVQFDGDQTLELDVNLEVLNIRVPDYNERKFILHTWTHPQAIYHLYNGCFHDGLFDRTLTGNNTNEHRCGLQTNGGILDGTGKNTTQLWTDKHFNWYKPVLEELYRSGQRNLFVNLVKDPWPNGWTNSTAEQQTYYPFDDLVIWKYKGTDDSGLSVEANWEVNLQYLFKYLDWAMGLTVDGVRCEWNYIDLMGPVIWAYNSNMRLAYYNSDYSEYKYLTNGNNVNNQNWQVVWKVFFKTLVNELQSRNKTEYYAKFRVMADERGINSLGPVTDNILKTEGCMLNGTPIKLSAAGNIDHNILSQQNSNAIQFFSYDLGGMKTTSSDPDNPSSMGSVGTLLLGSDETAKSTANARKAAGNDTTFSTTVTTYPSHANNGLPAESQYFGWYAARLGFSGHLKWSFDSWSGPKVNPGNANDIRTFPLLTADNKIFPAGDASHIYPGDPDAATPFIRSSVRQELAKEGYLYYDKILRLKEAYPAAAGEVDALLASAQAARPTSELATVGETGSTNYRNRRYLYDFADITDNLEAKFYEITKKHVGQ